MIKIVFEDEEGIEETYTLPSRYEVCPDCYGEGTTYLGWAAKDQPTFTQEDFDAEGPDFREDYMHGFYDATCPTCKGQRVVAVVNTDVLSPEQRKVYNRHLDIQADLAQMDREMEMERRMGA